MPEGSTHNGHRRKIIFMVIIGLIFGSIAVYHYLNLNRVTTDDAYIDGHIYSISPRIPGYVTQVHIRDNQAVQTGQILVTLDDTDYAVTLAEARAALAEAESILTSIKLGVPLQRTQTTEKVRGAEAELDSLGQKLAAASKQEEAATQHFLELEAEYDKALLDLRRMKALREGEGIAQALLDEVQTRVKTVQARMLSAQAVKEAAARQKQSVESDMQRIEANIKLAGTGEKQAVIIEHQANAQTARVELARARVRQAELNLSYTRIYAPADGHITRKIIEPGMSVSIGQPMMAVVPLTTGELWITANYKETQLTHVLPGQTAIIKVDTYPGKKFHGTVDSIMAGTGAAFSLFPPENASGNFVKVVQRIPVKITLDKNSIEGAPELRIGMSVVPTIITEH